MHNLAEKLSEQLSETTGLKLVVSQISVGEQLKKAREMRGWELPQIARRLNLSERYINAIEINDFDTLPGAVFVRGYLRNYAECVGLDSSVVIDTYVAHVSHGERPVKLRKRERLKAFSTAPIMRVLGVLSVLLFVLLSMYWRSSERQAVILPINDYVAVVEVETVEGKVKVEILDLGVPLAIEEVSSQSVGVLSIASVSGVDAIAPKDLLLVEFADSTWLEVREAGGKVLFSGVKQVGDVLQLASLMPFDIAIDNAAAVKLSYNSTLVDLSVYTLNNGAAKLRLGM